MSIDTIKKMIANRVDFDLAEEFVDKMNKKELHDYLEANLSEDDKNNFQGEYDGKNKANWYCFYIKKLACK